jgi:lysyl-tRNA synthetase class 2
VRAIFDAEGSVEVHTPAIVRAPGVDAHLDPIEVSLRPTPGAPSERRWLTTSPEYHMKRLLAAGSGPIHQLGRAWRDGERGRLHEPEFAMLEWYVPGLDDAGLMDRCEALVRQVAAALSNGVLRRGDGPPCAVDAPFDRIAFSDAFEEHAGVDPEREDERRLGRLLRASGHRPPRDAGREELVDLLLALVVQPRLGIDRPVFLTDWPADRAALARLRPRGDRQVAARFELYACGVELCNGYHELADPAEQRARIDAENARRVALGKEPLPVDEAFLAALDRGLPDCAGNALGLDRLLLLLTGADDLSAVQAFRLDD